MNQLHHPQWHKVVPRRELNWEDGQDGKAVLLVPRFRKGFLSRWLQPRLKRPHIRVKLDDIGSFVWRLFDGENDFTTIVSAMRLHFGEKIEPAEDRLQKFLVLLYKDRFVQLMTSVS